MGSFSYTFADIFVGKYANIVDGDGVKILIPKQFGGGYISATYEDYGEFRTEEGFVYDVYELLAIWNCNERLIKDINCYSKNAPHSRMKAGEKVVKYLFGVNNPIKTKDIWTENNRTLGIEIGCYKEQINSLEYPLKIAHKSFNGDYESCWSRSYGDPEQGFYHYNWNKFQQFFSDGFKIKWDLNGIPLKIAKYCRDEVYTYSVDRNKLFDWSFEPEIFCGIITRNDDGGCRFSSYGSGMIEIDENTKFFSTRNGARKAAAEEVVTITEELAKKARLYFAKVK